MALAGKVIAITGGAQGIGLATARLVASRGACTSILDNNSTTLESVEKEFIANKWPIHTFTADIRQADQVDAWIENAVKKFGRLDGAVNAAGTVGKFHGQKPIALLDDDDWNLVMGINVNGARLSGYYLSSTTTLG
ncbi:3-oxoacyl-reductase [Fusarium denticulatum]|uniref:3-oxoacyl-reductase n=1 Tax=Fusarium denticulatum TaxID=48507 RepID=A0A8H5WT73_9HYPO|nr:3-oxoacyl-reductase [Fusarium denticulatum]